MAAAGLWTTPSDLGRRIGDLLRATRGEPNTLLSPEAVRMMATPQLEGYVGLGLFLHGSGSATRLGHEGDTVGFQAEVFGYPSTGARFAVMSNSDVAYTLRKDIVRTLAVTYGWEDLSPSGRPPPVVHPDGESELAGTYRLRRSVLRVAYQKNALWLEVPEQKATRLNPRGKGVCVCTGANGSVVLQRRDGMVTGLVLRQDEQNLEADRLPSP